jgi:membrane fusion protein (multidrug efflux system)
LTLPAELTSASKADDSAVATAPTGPVEMSAADTVRATASTQALALPRGEAGVSARSTGGRTVSQLAIPVLGIGVAIALVLVASVRWDRWAGAAAVQTTDNATVRAETTKVSARVSGNVLRVAVKDYQKVRAGDLLLQIDPADYEAAVAQAEASVSAARAALDNLANQKALQKAIIAQAEAQQLAAAAREDLTRLERIRQEALDRGGLAGTKQRLEQATAEHQKAVADLAASEAASRAQSRQLDVLDGQEKVLKANLLAAEAALKTARLRLSYTRIVAPFDGIVGEQLVRDGDYVNVGTNLIAIVPLPNVYVIANYKETQLTHVQPGQLVEITVDMFPGETLRGRVVRLAPASGATFALLPPDNATGNFTKVVQRISVRIEFDARQPLLARLRPGMSVVTSIRVSARGNALTAKQGARGDG